ncbi:MAG: peroxiredoxin [Candidatus Cohnella colombiensis]|uniref:thioredoxin-dependent peroxiredoxin n=1 Tax=Candidatus Cohnella colombiensis TaxID=3121368 RepID=A0AA95JGW2_9BACL|nr:MAG: peroxiredoxin [Cohnella sp.]
MLNVGDSAPLFSADSTTGPLDLSQWINNQPIVLIFYPQDFTPGCTKQLCAVRDSKALYERNDAIVLGINAGSLQTHRDFAEQHDYDFPIVSDSNGRIRKAYGVSKILGIAMQQRTVFIIAPGGKIVFAEKGNRPTEELIGVLERLRNKRR